jgi:AraC-like DNA-binding protein/mannose-6-phosphate isomerase-like protein (cupin superfamily)
MAVSKPRKKEGFQGQQAIVLPRKILHKQCAGNSIISTLYTTDIGYYPKAKFHYRERPHGAEQHILIYCLEGMGEVTINKNRYSVEGGDFFIIPMKTAHTYTASDENPWTIYWLHFKGSSANELVSLMQKKFNGHKGFIRNNAQNIHLFNEIYHQLERGYGSDQLIYANMCLWHYLTTFIYNSQYQATSELANKDAVNTAIDFMSQRVDQVLTLEAIAASVNLSPTHFSTAFKKKTGFTPIEYLNHLKVQKACQYLLFTSLRIKEIALELGMTDQFYFSRMFSKVMGMSPNEYREEKKIH